MDGSAIAHALFDALDARDFRRFVSMFAPDARIWHNYDNAEKTVGDIAAKMEMAGRIVPDSRYLERRYVSVPDGAIAQHTLTGVTTIGGKVELRAMLHLYIKDGLIQRIEEYVDTGSSASIRAALQAA